MDSVKTVHSYYGLDQTADFPGDAVIKRSLSLIIFVRERLQSTSSIMLWGEASTVFSAEEFWS